MKHYDVVIIGAGSAGLAASIALGRSQRSVLVIDSTKPRNRFAHQAHNVLGQEGISPLELLRRGRIEACAYRVDLLDDEVQSITGSIDHGFTVTSTTATASARRIILATGVSDQLADIPGLDQAWGDTAIHCAYCHGWEVRGQRIAVLGLGAFSAHQALLFRQLSDQIVFINHAPAQLTAENRVLLDHLQIPIIEDHVLRLQLDAQGHLAGLELSNGDVQAAEAVVVATEVIANAKLFLNLGGTLTQHPMGSFIQADAMGATNVPGVYAAGNVTNLNSMIMSAAGSGTMAGAAVNADLANHDLALTSLKASP